MYTERYTAVALLALTVGSACAIPLARTHHAKRSALPFNQMVVFGDQLSDTGDGSYKHGLDPNDIYGFHTWTDGPVWPTYLQESLQMTTTSHAWGGAFGGGLAGATTSNRYSPAKDSYQGAPVPSTEQQVEHFIATTSASTIQDTLPLIWIGQNDVKQHTNWYNPANEILPTSTKNVEFFEQWTKLLVGQAESLIAKGAPAVVLFNLFPVQTAPENNAFFCKGDNAATAAWGTVIEAANSHLQSAISSSQSASKILYYDVYGFMQHVMENKDSYGFTEGLQHMCDGGPNSKLSMMDQCRAGRHQWGPAAKFFWFTNGSPETHVHQLIANNLSAFISSSL